MRILISMLAALGAAASAFASPAAAQSAPPPAPDYANDSSWLCLPGRADDLCSRQLAIAPLTASGWGTPVTTKPDADAPIDCFYVYPTVSGDPGMNSDIIPSSREELHVTQYEFTRFPEVCRPYVPLYRQMTMSAVAVAATGGDVTQAGYVAFSDIQMAFREYMARYNKGRPFVLIGHSQGAIMLDELIANTVEGTPAHDLMLRAYLTGWTIPVAPGADRPAKYKDTHLCRNGNDTGCVMTWSTFGEGVTPPPGAMFGRAPEGMTAACTNPAAPGSDDWHQLDGFYYVRSTYPTPGGPITWSKTAAPPTHYASAPAFLDARCVQRGNAGWLETRIHREPGDARTPRIGGEVGQFGIFLPGWGKHLADMSVGQGNMIADLRRLGERTKNNLASSTR